MLDQVKKSTAAQYYSAYCVVVVEFETAEKFNQLTAKVCLYRGPTPCPLVPHCARMVSLSALALIVLQANLMPLASHAIPFACQCSSKCTAKLDNRNLTSTKPSFNCCMASCALSIVVLVLTDPLIC